MPTLSFIVVVANVRSHGQCRRFPLTPNSLLHLLFVDLSMAVLTGGIWFLLVILIGIPSLMTRAAEHPVLGGEMGFVGVFSLYGCEENRPVAVGVVCVWNLFCNTRHRTFPEGSCHEQPPSPCELEVPSSGSWWWTGRPGVLQSMGSQRVGHDWATELNWTTSSQM